MKIQMTQTEAALLARYLNKKFAQRVLERGHGFTLTEFAVELGMKRSTVHRLMDERATQKGIQYAQLKALARSFGVEFLREMGLLE